MKNKLYKTDMEKHRRYRLYEAFTEYLFVLLPFIVMTIVLIYKDDFLDLAYLSEWSFAASVLTGQTIVKMIKKFVQITHESGKKPIVEQMGYLVALIIVILFVPSMVILALVVISDTASKFLAISQMILFIISSIVFFYITDIVAQAEIEASIIPIP